MAKKILYMLIGPKGAGKTHIGSLVQANTDIRFLRVEPIWLALQAGEDGWQKVRATIERLFEACDRVMIETLGVGDGFRGFASALSRDHVIKKIRVATDLETCGQRVRNRNAAEHIPVSDDKVAEYNLAVAASVHQHEWDAVIDNNGPADSSTILNIIRDLDRRTCQPGGALPNDP